MKELEREGVGGRMKRAKELEREEKRERETGREGVGDRGIKVKWSSKPSSNAQTHSPKQKIRNARQIMC